jgi:HD-GYP domain-containing protein (c-di-GMP phosphodiesterase class II)
MREHPLKSVEILAPLISIPFFKATLPGIRHHHERIDGYGYPDHLSGDQIPLTARIVTIADTFDAMTTSRVYREKLDLEKTYQELIDCSETQFDPEVAKTFVTQHKNIRGWIPSSKKAA